RLEQDDLVALERGLELRTQCRRVRRRDQPGTERAAQRLERRDERADRRDQRRLHLRDLAGGGRMQSVTLASQLQHRAHHHRERPAQVIRGWPASSRSAASGRTSAPLPVPATTVRVSRRAARASAGGSVPTTAPPAPGTSASFSRSTPSSEPKPSTCAYPTFVITAIVGSITSRSRAISPGTLAPASTTSASASSGAPRMVSGTPTRLFRLPLVACTRYR